MTLLDLDHGQPTAPRPWSCTQCGARLLWRRTTLDCPECGPVCAIPSYPTGKDNTE